jgi:LuxR family transcriptional activator of bioluminescence operon
MRLDSIEFGAVQGLSIPIHGPQEDFAILLLVQMRGQKCLENWQLQQYEFFAAAYYYYFYMQQQLLKNSKPAKKHQLNKREIQCLTLIAKQYSIEAIAQTLHITERTVNYHIQRLNKKLGAQNKYQSVIKALNVGLLQL